MDLRNLYRITCSAVEQNNYKLRNEAETIFSWLMEEFNNINNLVLKI